MTDHPLSIHWSAAYCSAWDKTPEEYVAHGIIAWGRSRRLAKAEDASVAFTAYLGVQHYDPARWHVAGDPCAKYFLSLFVAHRTIALRTFPTLADTLDALGHFHAYLHASDA